MITLKHTLTPGIGNSEISRPIISPAKGNILIIDDEILVSKAIRRILRRQTSQNAESIKSAIELIRSNVFDIIFCDLILGDGNGTEILKTIKTEINYQPDIHFTTGLSTSIARSQFNIPSRYNIIEKPFDIKLIREITERKFREIYSSE